MNSIFNHLLLRTPIFTALLVVLSIIIVLFSAGTFLRNQTWRDPIVFWADCVAKSPGKMPPHQNLNVELDKNGQIDEAIAHYHLAMDIDPVDSRLRGNYEKAHLFNNALRINPDSPAAPRYKGLIFLKQNEFDKAYRLFKDAQALDPQNKKSGNILRRLGAMLAKAEKLFHEQLAAHPDRADIHHQLGRIYEALDSREKALAHYQLAIEIHPQFIEAIYSLTGLYAGQGQYTAAIDIMSQAVSIDPHNPVHAYNMACLHAGNGDIDTALAWLEKAIDNGYDNWDRIMTDKDLQSVRGSREFKRLIKTNY